MATKTIMVKAMIMASGDVENIGDEGKDDGDGDDNGNKEKKRW